VVATRLAQDQARRCMIAKTERRRASGQLEAEILAILQRAGAPLTPGEVGERLGGDLAYTTVVTILSRLHAKGVLVRNRSHRAYAYVPVADEPGLAARRMRQVLDGEPDREAVLGHFVSDLSEQDEQLLRNLLLGARGEPTGPGSSARRVDQRAGKDSGETSPITARDRTKSADVV
jgi:predicted transcriptional regulator